MCARTLPPLQARLQRPLPRLRGRTDARDREGATNRKFRLGTHPPPHPSPASGGGSSPAAGKVAHRQRRQQQARLMFMMSSGGLTAASCSRARTRSSPGPPAAWSAWRESGRAAGFDRADRLRHGRHLDRRLAFRRRARAHVRDRGGGRAHARADDAHSHGRGRRRLDPALRRRALPRRPDSAGANPGPRSYRRGGPLTVTDANVMVGKLIPDFFPKIFGPAQNEPLDDEAVRDSVRRARAERSAGARRGDRGRLHPDRGREHGERDQEDLGAARLRRHPLHAQLLRRRRRPARLPGRRRARHDRRS